MQPYLESLPNYIDGAPPRTPTNMDHGITSRPMKHHHEVSPRGSRIYVLTTYQSYSNKLVIFIMHINLMPNFKIKPHSYSMLNPFQLILPNPRIYNCISYQFHATLITYHLICFTYRDRTNTSTQFIIYKYSMHFTSLTLYIE